jgi:hypothetical protein
MTGVKKTIFPGAVQADTDTDVAPTTTLTTSKTM